MLKFWRHNTLIFDDGQQGRRRRQRAMANARHEFTASGKPELRDRYALGRRADIASTGA